MKAMKEVTKEQLWEFVKDKNVSYSAEGNFPFEGFYKLNDDVIGKEMPVGRHLGVSTDEYKYYILDS